MPSDLLWGLQEDLRAQGLRLSLGWLTDAEFSEPAVMAEWSVDGCLVFYTHDIPEGAQERLASRMPACLWLNADLAKDCVLPDEIAASRELGARLTDEAGVDLTCYEGGSATDNTAASRHPEMYYIYRDFLDGIAPYVTMFNQYTVCGRGGKWGAKEYVNQPLAETPKYRALVDYINGVPAPNRPAAAEPMK